MTERPTLPARLVHLDFQKGRMLFLPHRLGKLYGENGARLHRDFFGNALHRIYLQPMVRTELPSAGRVTLLKQSEQHRYVAHLIPGHKRLSLRKSESGVRVVVPAFQSHLAVVLEY